MESCSKEKKKLSEYVLYYRFLKVALCFVDSAVNSWPSLRELHDVVT